MKFLAFIIPGSFLKHATQKAWELLGLLACLFFVHRWFAMSYLGASLSQNQNGLLMFAVGALGDIWVAGLFSLVFWIGAIPISLWGGANKQRWINCGAAVLVLLLGSATALHQPYVEFFRFQFIPFHIRYLFDVDFIAANSATAVNPRGIILWLLTVCAMVLMLRSRWRLKSGRILGAAYGLTLVLAVAAHSANLHYKVQLFLPLELQTHFLERLHYHLLIPVKPDGWSQAELKLLADDLKQQNADFHERDLLFQKAGSIQPDPLLLAIRKSFQEKVLEGRKPLMLVVLLESARPAETGMYWNSPETLTPHLESLAREGVWFRNAYSTSNVTRGGQEAVWCGYLSNVTSSMMRGRPDIHLDCLPKMVSRLGGQSFWFHGGRGEFDSQKVFWERQGVNSVLVQENFGSDVVKTDWGVSDLSLFRRSAEEITTLKKATAAPFLAGMILTVTNHIPWKLPDDASPALKSRWQGHTPAYFGTTAYTDEALGLFVADMRQRGLWDDLLLLVVSDHGMAGAPYFAAAGEGAFAEEELLSHIHLVLSGGVMNAVLKGSALTKPRLEFVSQADVAPFLGFVAGAPEELFQGQTLLSAQRQKPVVSDFGPKVYWPEAKLALPREEVILPPQRALDPAQMKSRLYYRLFLQWLAEPR